MGKGRFCGEHLARPFLTLATGLCDSGTSLTLLAFQLRNISNLGACGRPPDCVNPPHGLLP